jgi:hypothetical protein
MKRLTFDIDAALHRRIRIFCVERGMDMVAELHDILSEHYLPKSWRLTSALPARR